MAGRGDTPELKTYTESTAQDNATKCPLAEKITIQGQPVLTGQQCTEQNADLTHIYVDI